MYQNLLFLLHRTMSFFPNHSTIKEGLTPLNQANKSRKIQAPVRAEDSNSGRQVSAQKPYQVVYALFAICLLLDNVLIE